MCGAGGAFGHRRQRQARRARRCPTNLSPPPRTCLPPASIAYGSSTARHSRSHPPSSARNACGSAVGSASHDFVIGIETPWLSLPVMHDMLFIGPRLRQERSPSEFADKAQNHTECEQNKKSDDELHGALAPSPLGCCGDFSATSSQRNGDLREPRKLASECVVAGICRRSGVTGRALRRSWSSLPSWSCSRFGAESSRWIGSSPQTKHPGNWDGLYRPRACCQRFLRLAGFRTFENPSRPDPSTRIF
jgi:hypothetical protein